MVNCKRIADMLDRNGYVYYDPEHINWRWEARLWLTELDDYETYVLLGFKDDKLTTKTHVAVLNTLCYMLKDISGDMRLWRTGE